MPSFDAVQSVWYVLVEYEAIQKQPVTATCCSCTGGARQVKAAQQIACEQHLSAYGTPMYDGAERLYRGDNVMCVPRGQGATHDLAGEEQRVWKGSLWAAERCHERKFSFVVKHQTAQTKLFFKSKLKTASSRKHEDNGVQPHKTVQTAQSYTHIPSKFYPKSPHPAHEPPSTNDHIFCSNHMAPSSRDVHVSEESK